MNGQTSFERLLVAVLEDEAANGPADQAIDLILSTTRRMRPEPRWLVLLKEHPMRTTTTVVAGSPAFRRLFLVLAVIALVLLTAGALVAGASILRPHAPALPSPFGFAATGVLVYEVDGDLVSAPLSGGQPTPLITGLPQDAKPVFAHDGTRFTFVRVEVGSPERLFAARIDGSQVVSLIDSPVYSDWSPDDTHLAVIHGQTGHHSISILAADGGGTPRTLDLGGVVPLGWIGWRPTEGHELLFQGAPDGQAGNVAIYSIGQDGTDLHPITPVIRHDVAGYEDARFSPDGSVIGYWSWGPDEAGVVGGWGRVQDLSTGRVRIVHAYGGTPPQFSPDSKFVIGEADHQLVLEPVDGSPSQPIGPHYPDQSRIGDVLSPDGTKVILSLSGPDVTWIIDIASGQSVQRPQPLPNEPTIQRLAPAG